MYYCRYHETILSNAIGNDFITSNERAKIEEFAEQDIMYNISNDVEHLTNLGLELKEISPDKYLVTKWPFLKIMHLLVCKRNPRKWIYQDEDEVFLFGYIIQEDNIRLSLDASEF